MYASKILKPIKTIGLLFAATCLLPACSAAGNADARPETAATNQANTNSPTSISSPSVLKTTPMNMSFETPQSLSDWRAINDGVMGGKSIGGVTHSGEAMTFSGSINTDGGGFSSIRTEIPKGTLAGAIAIKITLKSDGRPYKLSLRSSETYRGRQIAFQSPLGVEASDDWTEVTVNISDLKPSLFGQEMVGPSIDASDVHELGFILADGQNGPFVTEIKSITALPAP